MLQLPPRCASLSLRFHRNIRARNDSLDDPFPILAFPLPSSIESLDCIVKGIPIDKNAIRKIESNFYNLLFAPMGDERFEVDFPLCD